MTQPEALRLADELSKSHLNHYVNHAAAAELRRLHNLAMEQQGKIYALEMARSMEQKTAKLKRDALLEALQDLCDEQEGPPLIRRHRQWQAAIDKARAAIAKAEENT